MFNTSVTSLLNKAVALCEAAVAKAQEQQKTAELKRKELQAKLKQEQEKANKAMIDEANAANTKTKLKEFIVS
ncbi:hypothetical protein [Alteromonas sp. BMJM2]|uniref:hypothetical protein n=1 Tax=Alteromonas sp. BMJM2 TaxID=2954241 RepID=UPI0022B47869|nr:hypothetical protein [Alteromonas sp. BMJM2]